MLRHIGEIISLKGVTAFRDGIARVLFFNKEPTVIRPLHCSSSESFNAERFNSRWTGPEFAQRLKESTIKGKPLESIPCIIDLGIFGKYFERLARYCQDGCEYGTVIAVDMPRLQLYVADSTRGDRNSVAIKWAPPPGRSPLEFITVLSMHTHPRAADGQFRSFQFSPQDLVGIMCSKQQQIEVVVTGPSALMAVKTPATITRRWEPDEVRAAVKVQHQKRRPIPDYDEYGISCVTKAACRELGLALYFAKAKSEWIAHRIE